MRKSYSKDLKAKVVLELFKGRRTAAEIASHYQVHPNQLSKWKKKALKELPEIFSRKNGKSGEPDNEQLTNELYQQIGQLKVELDWLKKKSGLLG